MHDEAGVCPQQPSGGAPLPPAHVSGAAIASLVCGLLGFVTLGLGGLLGIILGIQGLYRVKKGQGQVSGGGIAVAGICVSALSLLTLPILPAVMATMRSTKVGATRVEIRGLEAAFIQYARDWGAYPPDKNQTLSYESAECLVYYLGTAFRVSPDLSKGEVWASLNCGPYYEFPGDRLVKPQGYTGEVFVDLLRNIGGRTVYWYRFDNNAAEDGGQTWGDFSAFNRNVANVHPMGVDIWSAGWDGKDEVSSAYPTQENIVSLDLEDDLGNWADLGGGIGEAGRHDRTGRVVLTLQIVILAVFLALVAFLVVAIKLRWIGKGGFDLKKLIFWAEAPAGTAVPGGWTERAKKHAIKGDLQNTGRPSRIEFDAEKPWRVVYGTRTKPEGEKGHFNLSVYRRDPETGQAGDWIEDIARLGPGVYVKDQTSRVFEETGPCLVQADAETGWWAVRVEQEI